METRSVRAALLLVMLLGVLMSFFACNGGSAGTTGGPATEAELPDKTALLSDPCHGVPEANRVAELQHYLSNTSMGDSNLDTQRNVNGHFRFNVNSYNSSTSNLKVLVTVYGRVVGQDDDNNNKPPKMKNFLKFLEKGMKKGCIDRVSFEPMPSVAGSQASSSAPDSAVATSATTSTRGFEWQTCLHPEFPCDTGRCSQGQICKRDETPTPSPTATP